MPIIHLLQRIATFISADEAMEMVVLVAALGAALCTRIRKPDALKRHRHALGSMALGATALLLAPRDVLPIPVIAFLWVAVATGFVLHTLSEARAADDDPEEKEQQKVSLTVWFGVALGVAVLFLATDLGGYADTLMV